MIKTMQHDSIDFKPEPNRIYSSVATMVYDILIDEPLIHPSDWREELNLLRNVGPDDVVNLRINSPGGSSSVAIAFLKAMSECCAKLIGHNEGECSSAATLLFLGCDEWCIAEGSELMIHTASSGYHGKENNFYEYAIHLNKTVNSLLTKHYKGFLTDEEISQVLKGTDMWMDEEEVKTRLENLIKHREEDIGNSISTSEKEAFEYLKSKTKEEILKESFPDLYEEACLEFKSNDKSGCDQTLFPVTFKGNGEVILLKLDGSVVSFELWDSIDTNRACKLLTVEDIKNICKYLYLDTTGLKRKRDLWDALVEVLVRIYNED